MNVLFILYGDLESNSASHVDGLARGLVERGWDCAVAAVDDTKGRDRFGATPYRVVSHRAVAAAAGCFADGRGPAIVHAWNPREITRKLVDRLATRCRFRTVVHLEDNERHIARSFLGPAGYRLAERDAFPGEFPAGLSHPVRSRRFMEQADGFTLLIDSLAEHVPAGKPSVTFWPAVDPAVFHARPRNDALRAELGIPPDTCVVTYHGNTHAANAAEVRSLYLAVALLNRNGVPTKLVRVGSSYVNLPPEHVAWANEFTIDLGFVVDRRRLAEILALADIFVQPGASDPFNDYRFPSKVPEFFALGRPVILPRTNIGLVTRHLNEAYVLDVANGSTIFQAVRHLVSDPGLRERLAAGGQAFAKANLSWARAASVVAGLYGRILGQPSRQVA